MASAVRGKALVAKLRADPKTVDAEALAAWIGRTKRLRAAGVPAKKAKALAGKKGGLKEAGVKGATPTRKTGGKGTSEKPEQKSVALAGGGKATYNPSTKTATIPNSALDLGNRNRSKENIGRIEKAFPGVEKVGTTEANAMDLDRLKRSFGIQADKPRSSGMPTTTRTPSPDEPRNDPAAQRATIEEAIERRRLAREAEDAKRKEKEARLGINVRRARPFYTGDKVLIRIAPDREPTERDKAKILQAYPRAKTFEWNGKDYPLQKGEVAGKASVGEFMTIPAGGGKRLTAARDAVKASGRVHDVEGMTPIPVTTSTRGSRNNRGAFQYDMNKRPVRINVKSADHPKTTMAHEIGHYLDLDGLGNKGSYSSQDPGSEASFVMDAIDASPTGKRLADMRTNPEKYGEKKSYTRYDGTVYEYTTTPDRRHLSYMGSPEEMFARAYSQYISRKGGDKAMKSEMAEQIKESQGAPSSYPYQWTDEEFAPIERAFDEMFRRKGWLK